MTTVQRTHNSKIPGGVYYDEPRKEKKNSPSRLAAKYEENSTLTNFQEVEQNLLKANKALKKASQYLDNCGLGFVAIRQNRTPAENFPYLGHMERITDMADDVLVSSTNYVRHLRWSNEKRAELKRTLDKALGTHTCCCKD